MNSHFHKQLSIAKRQWQKNVIEDENVIEEEKIRVQLTVFIQNCCFLPKKKYKSCKHTFHFDIRKS